MHIEPISALPALRETVLSSRHAPSFEAALGSAADMLSNALARADALAAAVGSDKANIAEAAIARAKADVMLEVAAIAASRLSSAISTLWQTQV